MPTHIGIGARHLDFLVNTEVQNLVYDDTFDKIDNHRT